MDDIDNVVKMIDESMQSGVSRLHIGVNDKGSDNKEGVTGNVKKEYHHGRCDVGSAFAKGTVTNCESIDIF